MKKIFLIGFLSSYIFLAWCWKNNVEITSKDVSNSTWIDLTQNIRPSANIQNIEIIPIIQNQKIDCEKYGWNESLRMADPTCSWLPNISSNDTSNWYVVAEYETQSQTSASEWKKISMNETMSSTNTKNSDTFSKDITRNWFYHPSSVPIYGPWIHVNDKNTNIKMWYGPYENNLNSLN